MLNEPRLSPKEPTAGNPDDSLQVPKRLVLSQVREDEPTISQRGIGSRLRGAPQELVDRARRLFKLPPLETYEKETFDVEIEGKRVTFYHKLSGSKHTWAYSPDDADLIERAVRNAALLSVQSDEIAISPGGIGSRVRGVKGDVVARAKDVLGFPDPKGHPSDTFDCEIEGRRIVLTKRLFSTFRVWVYGAQDAELVEKAVEAAGLIPPQKGETAISSPSFRTRFTGNSEEIVARAKKLFELPEPTEGTDRTIVREIDGRKVTFTHRLNHSAHLWVYSDTDRDLVETAIKNSGVLSLQPGEVAITANGIGERLRGQNHEIQKRAKQLFGLPEPDKHPEMTFECEIDGQRVALVHRFSGRTHVWAYGEDIRELVEGAVQNAGYLIVQPGETAVSTSGIGERLRGMSSVVVARAKRIFGLPNAGEYDGDTFEAHYEGRKVTFYHRLSYRNHVWAYTNEDQEFIEELVQNTKDYTTLQVQVGETPISASGIGQKISGSAAAIVARAKDILGLPEPAEYEGEIFECEVGGAKLSLPKRMNHSIAVWVYGPEDAELIERAVRKCNLSSVQSGEVLVTESGIGVRLRGKPAETAAQAKQVLGLPDPEEYETEHFECKIDGHTITLTRREHMSRPTWVYRCEDEPLIAKALNRDILVAELKAFESPTFADAVALLRHDPYRLITHVELHYPELSPRQQLSLTQHGLQALGGRPKNKYEGYDVELEPPDIVEPRRIRYKTKDNSLEIQGIAPSGVDYIQVTGDYGRTIKVRSDGSFKGRVALPKTGETNRFVLFCVNKEDKTISPAVSIKVLQTGKKPDLQKDLLDVLKIKDETLAALKSDPVRYAMLVEAVEISKLKLFTSDEERGLRELERHIAREKQPLRKELLQGIYDRFKEIHEEDYGIKEGQRAYFFQKYVAHKVLDGYATGDKGRVVAMEQGLGKTLVNLMVVDGKRVTIIAPNAVVSTWIDEERKFFSDPRLVRLEGTYQERDQDLDGGYLKAVVTNIEYARGMTEARARGLASEYLTIDEADILGSRKSQQSLGIRQVRAISDKNTMLTATPVKGLRHLGNILNCLEPEDQRFNSTRAFIHAFSPRSPEAMRALRGVVQRHVIRIRKKDVFEEYDKNKPLNRQRDKLPAKVEVASDKLDRKRQPLGDFSLRPEQCESILMLFTNYEQWCREHRGFETEEDREYARYSEGFFSKREALRQICNDPKYIGLDDLSSPKHLRMDNILRHEFETEGAEKVLIFCRYKAEVQEYIRRYGKKYGVCSYYGDTPSDCHGYKIDGEGRRLLFETDTNGDWVLDSRGHPVESDNGQPMKALDYEKLLFQNSKDHRVMVATYDTGAVGVTLTAADAVIYDDYAPTYRDEYQAADRAHRIDNKRKKYEVRYYHLRAKYSNDFLEALPEELCEKYFSMGTYDEVHAQNLAAQKELFHYVLDGVGDEEEIARIQRTFAEKMPFLFTQAEAERERARLLLEEIEESKLVTRDDTDGAPVTPSSVTKRGAEASKQLEIVETVVGAATPGSRGTFTAVSKALHRTSLQVQSREGKLPTSGKVVLNVRRSTTEPAEHGEVAKLRMLFSKIKNQADWDAIAGKYKELLPYLSTYLTTRVGLLHLCDLALQGQIQFPRRIISVGSGSGNLYDAACELGGAIHGKGLTTPEITDLDFSQAMVALSHNPSKIRASALHLPFADRSQQAIECSSPYDLRSPQEVEAFIAEASRVLKKGGLLWLKADGLYFGQGFAEGLRGYGFKLVDPLNSELVIPKAALAGSSTTERAKVEDALKSTRFVFAKKTGWGGGVEQDGLFSFVRRPTLPEEVAELRRLYRDLTKADSDEKSIESATKFAEAVAGMSDRVLYERGKIVLAICHQYLKHLFTDREVGRLPKSKGVEALRRQATRLSGLIENNVNMLEPNGDDSVVRYLNQMKKVAEAMLLLR